MKLWAPQIKEDDSTMALSVLNSLVEAYAKAPTDAKAAAAAMQALNAEYDLVEVALASLEARACSLNMLLPQPHTNQHSPSSVCGRCPGLGMQSSEWQHARSFSHSCACIHRGLESA